MGAALVSGRHAAPLLLLLLTTTTATNYCCYLLLLLAYLLRLLHQLLLRFCCLRSRWRSWRCGPIWVLRYCCCSCCRFGLLLLPASSKTARRLCSLCGRGRDGGEASRGLIRKKKTTIKKKNGNGDAATDDVRCDKKEGQSCCKRSCCRVGAGNRSVAGVASGWLCLVC